MTPLLALALGSTLHLAQIPDSFTNLKVLPRDIARDSLIQIMRGFSLQLNVRCQYCHTGGDGQSFAGVEFAKDDKPAKRRARFMLQMVDSLNRRVLPNLPELNGRTAMQIQCKTCHRGSARPEVLTQRLERVRDSIGVDSAIALFRRLRTDEGMAGRYDFGEWEMNLWAERLARSNKEGDAIRVYELNFEFFPQSASIMTSLGQLYEPRDKTKALDYYRRAAVLQPRNQELQRRIQRLEQP